ncbi:hypothetical protein BUALT_Bualt15G0137600 [Buddleja alternifolia]|uniref:PsbP C-terminal domain-containing protein n=1 Tax=Buddleja alternifolia TaxID=168488 RepID=A0AAV6WFK2_9LAMI|nr:hypothetical protein BUALT_Bualt15G0137600 [Buddleja alternifolia]
MAPICCLNSLHSLILLLHSITVFFIVCQGFRRSNNINNSSIICCNNINNSSIICCCNNINGIHHHKPVVGEECGTTRRRELLFRAVSAALVFPPLALAAPNDLPDDFRVYTDQVNKFQITIPQGEGDAYADWQVGNGEGDGVRSLIAFYPQEASTSNVSIVITGLGADFTRLESFGKVDAFAENLVGGLDRSWQRPPGVAAKLIDSKAANGLYYIEYTLKNPGESRRHLFSVLGMANNGIYNRLYTLTGQFVDEEEEKFGPKIQKAVSSFRLI